MVNKRWLISAFVLALTLQGCGSKAVVVGTPTQAVVYVEPTRTPLPDRSQIETVPFGSEVLVDGMKLSVASAVRPADGLVASGDMFNPQPEEFEQYVFVNLSVTCEAGGSDPCRLDLFKFKLWARVGDPKYPKWFLSGVEGILEETEIKSGATITGYVPFLVSIGDSGLLFMYESLSGDSIYMALP